MVADVLTQDAVQVVTMVHAANKVVAITELLEQILVDVSISVERLFTIQRVSQHFKATITESFYLQGKMHLRHLTEREYGARMSSGTNPLLTRFLRDKKLELRPFTAGSPEIRTKDNRCLLQYQVNTGMVRLASEFGTRLGLRGTKRFHGCEGSWSKMKVTMVLIGMDVCVFVNRRDKFYRMAAPTESGWGTLGDLVSWLQKFDSQFVAAYEAAEPLGPDLQRFAGWNRVPSRVSAKHCARDLACYGGRCGQTTA